MSTPTETKLPRATDTVAAAAAATATGPEPRDGNGRPMILMLAHSYYPSDPRIRREAESLVRAGHRVRVISTSSDGAARTYELGGVEVKELAIAKTRASLVNYAVQYARTTLLCYFETRAALREGLAAVHVHTLPDFLTWAAIPARRKGLPVILDFHESMPDFYSSKYKNELLTRFLTWLEGASARVATHLITVNDEIADAFEKRLGRRPLVVMNTVDETLFPPESVRTEQREKARVLGYHGTITDIYGLDLLIEAMPAVLEQVPDARVEIFGDGPARPRLEDLSRRLGVADHVLFRGRVPLNDMWRHLQTVDVGVVPTRKDRFLNMSLATKLLEYVYMNVPVVCSDLDAVKRLFGEESSGPAYFEGNRSDALAMALVSALRSDRGERQARAEASRGVYSTVCWPLMERRLLAEVDTALGFGTGKVPQRSPSR